MISSSAVHKKYKPFHLHKASAAFLIQYLFSVHAQVQTDEWSMKYVSGSAGRSRNRCFCLIAAIYLFKCGYGTQRAAAGFTDRHVNDLQLPPAGAGGNANEGGPRQYAETAKRDVKEKSIFKHEGRAARPFSFLFFQHLFLLSL